MAEFPDYSEGNPRWALHQFIVAIGQLLDELLSGSNDSARTLFIPQLLPDVRAAWDFSRPRVGSVAEAAFDISDSLIAHHDLEGPPLRAKLGVVRYYYDQFVQTGAAHVLKRLLGAIDTLLKSFTQATGVSGFLEELKETTENIIEDAAPLHR
jgi:hypothetical protein